MLTEEKGDRHLTAVWGCKHYKEVFEIIKDGYTGFSLPGNDVGLSGKLTQGTLDSLNRYIQ